MASTTVPQAPTNGHAPATITRLIPRVASRVDELFRLRALLREAQEAERAPRASWSS